MALSLAIVGPGRVGRALGRRWAEGGIELLGFVGRDPAAAADAVRYCGAGHVLEGLAALGEADAVVLAVGDDQLAELDAAAAAAGPSKGQAWLHCSGRFGPEVLRELASVGAAVGALHPLCPFPDADTGYRLVGGRIAVLEGEVPLLETLAQRAGLVPLWIEPGDRAIYHAACALAAGGLTALQDLVCRLFRHHGGIDDQAASQFSGELMGAALAASGELGATLALSGPVLRGDLQTVRAHLDSLQAVAPETVGTYVALMRHAVVLAEQRGLEPDRARAIGALLDALPRDNTPKN